MISSMEASSPIHPSYYVSQPIAFGVTKDGLAEIDHFNFGIQIGYNGSNYQMTGLNRERQNDETIIFTPQYGSSIHQFQSIRN